MGKLIPGASKHDHLQRIRLRLAFQEEDAEAKIEMYLEEYYEQQEKALVDRFIQALEKDQPLEAYIEPDEDRGAQPGTIEAYRSKPRGREVLFPETQVA